MVRIFCDFDGTVCPDDIGAKFFRTFAGDVVEEFFQDLLGGKINTREMYRRECAAIPHVDERMVGEFVDRFSVDPHFPAFVEFVEAHGAEVVVVSDGMELYVRRLLERAGLGRIPAFANPVRFVADHGVSRIELEFPHTDAECDRCGNCKRNHMLSRSADDDVIVYVGDGFSDRCPVRFADVVFARKHLIPFCQEQNITYHEFRHFGDVKEKMELLFRKPRIPHRREAGMARRAVFMQG